GLFARRLGDVIVGQPAVRGRVRIVLATFERRIFFGLVILIRRADRVIARPRCSTGLPAPAPAARATTPLLPRRARATLPVLGRRRRVSRGLALLRRQHDQRLGARPARRARLARLARPIL